MSVKRSIRRINTQLQALGTAGRVGAGIVSVAIAGRLAYAIADTITYPLYKWPEVRSPVLFYLGFGTGIAAYALHASPQSALSLGRQPAKIYSQSFRSVRANKDIQVELGAPIKFGGFRQLHFVPGSINFDALTEKDLSPAQRLAALWKPRETHLLYLIRGPHGTAIVNLNDRYGKQSCQVIPTKGDLNSIIVTGAD